MKDLVLWLIALLAVIVVSAELGDVEAICLWLAFGAATWSYVRVHKAEWEKNKENDHDAR